jgi:hypothetical protein
LRFVAGGTEVARFRIASGLPSSLQLVNGLSVGNATPSSDGAGITFPATQSASSDANTLDDYEEGTWTPVMDTLTAGAGRVTTFTSANYTKVGNVVTFDAFVVMATLGSGGSGAWVIKGLPFTSKASTYFACNVGYFLTLNSSVTYITTTVNGGTTEMEFRGTTAAASSISSLAFSTFVTTGTSVIVSGSYLV